MIVLYVVAGVVVLVLALVAGRFLVAGDGEPGPTVMAGQPPSVDRSGAAEPV